MSLNQISIGAGVAALGLPKGLTADRASGTDRPAAARAGG